MLEPERLGSGFPDTVSDGAGPPTPGTPAVARVGRYPVLGELGRGGMGAVLLSRDPELGRDLALKVMREDCAARPEVVQRFREEAQVGGQLQHPSVVPVYELGCSTDGRPYFTMKLVKGTTLARLLKERADPTQERPRFLKVFEQVCQAVAYAHSKGVIHRDLKPSNVMVGAFGEVQVMDWGLAKVLARADATEPVAGQPSTATVSAAVRVSGGDSDTPETQEGDVLGTPAYMAPEQALGEISRLNQRCDVFSLGAILCEVLTGAPPYAAADRVAVLRQARRAELGDALARLAACGADEELVSLTRRCLTPEPAERPPDGGAVARAVEAYLAGVEERARRAELERARAEARAVEERKRRRVQLALGGAVLLLVVGGGTGAWLVQQHSQARQAEVARRRQDALAAVAVQLAEARNLRKQAGEHPLGDPARFRQAQATARQAVKLIDASEAAGELRPEAEALVRELGEEVVAAERDRVLLAALLEVRGPREGPKYRTDDKGLAVALAEPSADEQFQAAFKAWGLDVDAMPTAEAATLLKRRPRGVVTEVVAALDEWASERAGSERLSALATALDDGRGARQRRDLRGLLAAGRLRVERALGMVGVLLRPVPVPFDAGPGPDRQRLRRLAADINAETEPVLGLLTLMRALQVAGDDAVAERLVRAALRARPQEVVLHEVLGRLLEGQRPPRWAEAVECHAAARALRAELGEALAWALVQSGRVEEGLALYERLLKERPGNPWLHFRHGFALDSLRKPAEAEAAFRKAIALQPDYAKAYNGLGAVLSAQKKPAEAEAAYRKAIALQPDFAQAYYNLGLALDAQRRPAEAEAACRQAIALQPDFAEAYVNLGNVLSAQKKYAEAEASFRKAIALRPDYAQAYNNLGNALIGQQKPAEAEAAYKTAIALKPDCAEAYYNLGVVLLGQKKPAEAEAAFCKAIALRPDFAQAYHNLGNALAGQKKLPGAEAAYRKAIARQPSYPEAHCNLGRVLRRQGRFAEAIVSLRRGHALGSKLPGWPYPSAAWVRRCEHLLELDRRLPVVLRGDARPVSPTDGLEFASLCQLYKRRHAAAARLYADAFAAEPKLARQHRYLAACSALLAATGKGEDAARLPVRVVLTLRRQALRWLRADLEV